MKQSLPTHCSSAVTRISDCMELEHSCGNVTEVYVARENLLEDVKQTSEATSG